MKLKTNWREVAGAIAGSVIGAAIPLILGLQAAKIGDAEISGLPIVALSLPGLFIGAIIGVSLARKRNRV